MLCRIFANDISIGTPHVIVCRRPASFEWESCRRPRILLAVEKPQSWNICIQSTHSFLTISSIRVDFRTHVNMLHTCTNNTSTFMNHRRLSWEMFAAQQFCWTCSLASPGNIIVIESPFCRHHSRILNRNAYVLHIYNIVWNNITLHSTIIRMLSNSHDLNQLHFMHIAEPNTHLIYAGLVWSNMCYSICLMATIALSNSLFIHDVFVP